MALTPASINVQRGEDGHADVALFQMAKSMLGAPLVICIQGQSEIGDLYLCLKANPFGRELQYKFIESP